MSITAKTKRYYSWNEVWRSKNPVDSKELELAMYKLDIKARLIEVDASWVLEVPWPYLEVAAVAIEAFREGRFEYPSEIIVNQKWESYNRFHPVKSRMRSSKMYLFLGLAVFLVLAFQMIYGLVVR